MVKISLVVHENAQKSFMSGQYWPEFFWELAGLVKYFARSGGNGQNFLSGVNAMGQKSFMRG